MKGSLRLFSLVGIPVFIHWTFLILLAWIFGISLYRGGGWEEGLASAAYVLAVFGCVVLHEFGHALAARRYGIGTKDITLLPIGGVARLERMPEKPLQEIVVALAGPLVNVAIAAVLFAIGGVQSFAGMSTEQVMSASPGSFLHSLMIINVFLVLFNMIPAFPMDGGRVLRATLALFMEYVRATRIAARVGQVCAVGFALAGLLGNPFLVLIAVFVWIGAQAEAQAAESRVLFRGLFARDAMLTEFRVLHPDITLDSALRELLHASQSDFPVVQDGRVVGVVSRADLLHAIAAHGPATPVSQIMQTDYPAAEEHEPLQRTFERMSESSSLVVPVLRDGLLVGIITRESLVHFVAVRSATGRAWSRPAQQPSERQTVTVRRRDVSHFPS